MGKVLNFEELYKKQVQNALIINSQEIRIICQDTTNISLNSLSLP
jgi:hypothetical protein